MNFLILAAAEAAPASATQLILPATAELVYGAIAFIVVLVLMTKFAFPALNKTLDERREAIQGQMEAAEATKAAAAAEAATFHEKLAAASGDADRLVEEAKQTAEQLRRDIVAKAEAEAAAVKARAQADVASERDRLLGELRGEVGQLSVALASKIVEKELDAAAHQGLVDEYIAQLSRS
ncbi:MAG: F-type H+-transporting ATPase subunit b [Nitriliruptoraceae bacterium]|jgi:F-type H+-transporting ATPase subunit b